MPFPSLGNLPDPGIKLGSPALQADTLPSEPPGKPKLPEGSDFVPLEIPGHGRRSLNIYWAENDEWMDGSMGGWVN